MTNWRLTDLRGDRRRNFLKLCTATAAAVGVARSRLLDFLADEGGYGLAEAAGSSYGRSLVVPCPNGVFAWFQELWPQANVGLMACQNANIPGLSATFGSTGTYLYTSQLGFAPANGYRGTYAPGKGVAMPTLPAGVKGWSGGDRPFFYGPDAPWFDHAAGVPKYPVTALMAGKDETHTEFPLSATAVSGAATLVAALGSLGAANSSAVVPVLGIDPVRYGRAPGAPDVATVPSANGMIDLFNSAASQFALVNPADRQIFEDYYKAVVGLRRSANRSSWTPHLAVTKNAARIIGLNFAAQLTPTSQDLVDFGIQAMNTAFVSDGGYLTLAQKNRLEEFGRVLIVVAKAFALGLSKTAIVALSPGPTGDTSFTDPHVTFASATTRTQGRNTTQHLGRILDGFYAYLAKQVDPENPTEKLDQSTTFVAFGDTPHTPLRNSVWPDATPDACNWLYVMDPKQNIRNGWFGQCSPVKFANGRNGVGYDPSTGADDPNKTSDQMTQASTTATLYAVARGDKNKLAEYGVSAANVPALLAT